MSPINDPKLVRREYADESRFAVRAGAWARSTGPSAIAMHREAVAEVAPRRVLEVGCGRGETAEWIARETGAEVVAVDQSERMVELTSARGVEAHVGDVEDLPFENGSFDCVVAAWMLYHVADLDRGLTEIARVLRPSGRLVAVTNSKRHCQELKALVGVTGQSAFSAENGEEILRRHFSEVERRDAEGYAVFEPDEAIAYIEAMENLWRREAVPAIDEPIRVTKAPVVFVATK
ncbi:MAG TPA: class I SAM-dependent methyltransferase [Gaiellaceae bacterium]|nr:class I SAM-dependent methyltransferase [Gaiellaceae bacterium]